MAHFTQFSPASIFSLFSKAEASGIKWPKIRFDHAGQKVVIYKAKKGYLAVMLEDTYIGKLMPSGTLSLYIDDTELVRQIESVLSQPQKELALIGKKQNHCCFCGRELNNSISVSHGYGPICAENFGLPWEEESEPGVDSL